jgi:hypothetical protein
MEAVLFLWGPGRCHPAIFSKPLSLRRVRKASWSDSLQETGRLRKAWVFALSKDHIRWKLAVLHPAPVKKSIPLRSISLTFLCDSEGDEPCGLHKGPMRLKFKLPRHVAGVEARVIQSDIEHGDGYILQVLAPVPLQTPLEGALHLLVAIAILKDKEICTALRPVEPFHHCGSLHLFPLHAGDASQLHGGALDSLCL